LDGPAADTDPNVSYTYGYGLSGDAATYARLEKITLPGGRQVYYNYEDANAFASLGRVGDIADGSSGGRTKYVAYKYLGASTVVDADHPAGPAPLGPTGLRLTLDPNADKAYAGFDRLGRVIDQKWARSNSADPNADRFGYTYDRASNRLTRSLALKSAYNETYHYDGLDRLKDANRPGDSGMGQLDQSWTLRPTGNWSSFSSAGVTQTRTHNNANEILTITRDPIDPPDPLYDPAGSNVFGPKPNDDANGMHCRYDAWNRLATVHLDDGGTPGTLDGSDTLLATYRYDGLNRRVKKVTHADANTTTDYVFFNDGHGLRSLGEAGWQIVEVRRGVNAAPDANTAPYKQFVYDIRYIDSPVCRWWDKDSDGTMEPAAGEMQYFTNDGNFNTTALIDANSGSVVERYLYDPYGKPTFLDANWAPRSSSSYDNDVLYCGYWYDPETGLYHVRERYYDPITGTWKTRDRILYPDGMSLYEYVRSSPVTAADPIGLVAHNFKVTDETQAPPNSEQDESARLSHQQYGAVNPWDGLGSWNPLTVIPAKVKFAYLQTIRERAQAQASAVASVYPQAAAALRHFLNNSGLPRTFDYSKLLQDDRPGGSHMLENLTAAQEFVAANPRTASNGAGRIAAVAWVGQNEVADFDWSVAVGQYYTWSRAEKISCKPGPYGRVYQMLWHIYAEDFYDWDRDDWRPVGLVSPAELWLLHIHGWAKQYSQSGKVTYKVVWEARDVKTRTITEVKSGQ